MTERKLRWVEPPTFLLAIAAVVALLGIGMSAYGSQKTGLFTDDPGHALRLTHYLDDGVYTREFEVVRTAEGEIPDGAYVYGPATLLFSHDVNRLLNDERPDEAGMWPYQYAVRHAVVAAMGLAGLLAAAGLAWSVLGSWRWGVVTAGLLSAIPLWTGQTMFNPKDVPVAAGHTVFTLGLVLLAATKPTARFWWPAFAAILTAGGTFVAIGTRPGTWAPMAVVLTVFVLAVIRSRPVQTRANLMRISAYAVAALVAAYGGLLVLYPKVFSHPITMLRVSASSSADYFSFGLQTRSDRDYFFDHMATDMPLGILTLMAIGTAIVVWMLVVQRRRETRIDGMALVGAQAWAVVAAAVILNTPLYNGLRQLLLAYPALAVLATVGLAALMTALAGKNVAQSLLTVAAALALVLPTAVQFAMFPYQYAYINVAAEQLGVQAEEDYFGTSFRELSDMGPQDVKFTCPFLRFGGEVYRTAPDCRKREQGTVSTYWKGHKALDNPKRGEFYTLLRGNRATPPNCAPYREVRRWRNLEPTVESRMFKCHRPTQADILKGEKFTNKNRVAAGFAPKPLTPGLDKPVTYPPAPDAIGPVVAYLAERKEARQTSVVAGAVRLHVPDDVDQLVGASADFKAFMRTEVERKTAEIAKRMDRFNTSKDELDCTFDVDVSVYGVAGDVATGREWGCGTGARKAVWVKGNGTWYQATLVKAGFWCDQLNHFRVPAAIADSTCWDVDGWAVPYRGPKD